MGNNRFDVDGIIVILKYSFGWRDIRVSSYKVLLIGFRFFYNRRVARIYNKAYFYY